MNNVIEVKNLSKKYPSFELKNVSFSLPQGMIMGLIGENGAGKTTTIKALLNIIKTYTGDIKIFGLNPKENDKQIKEDIGVVLDEMFFPEILTPQDINGIMKGIYESWDSNLYYKYLNDFKVPLKKTNKNFIQRNEEKTRNYLLSSHNMTDLEHIADYITFINNGEVILSKSTNDILDNYALVKCTEEEFKNINKNDYIKYGRKRISC